jgi:two-component system nitrogen regulation response regulator GlnG
MADPDVPTTTLQPPDAGPAEPPRAVALTILCHPDLGRVGEIATLADLEAGIDLGRATPRFSSPEGSAPRGLEDTHISGRRPLPLRRTREGLCLSAERAGMRVVLDGVELDGAHVLGARELARGVVLELAQRVVLHLREVPEPSAPRPPRLGLVGASEALEELRRGIVRVADLPVPVLVRGETGTGKELVARAVHEASPRASRPFVAVNLAAIPGPTAASELFGHARGAFTGAVGAHAGYFERAAGGTLFLDEIGATPADVQPLLLRALESGEVQPLGASAPRIVDVRLVAATDAALEDAAASDSFRAALLHRLEGAQLFLPPLRERREDLGRLVAHFLRLELAATGDLHRLERAGGAPWLPASLVAELARLAWPGNVRQLRSVIRQLAIASRGEPRARVDATVSRLIDQARGSTPAGPAAEAAPRRADPAELDDAAIAEAMRACGFAAPRAAARLGVSRSYLYERLKTIRGLRMAKDLDAAEIGACRAECQGDLAAMARRLGVSPRALQLRMRELGLS